MNLTVLCRSVSSRIVNYKHIGKSLYVLQGRVLIDDIQYGRLRFHSNGISKSVSYWSPLLVVPTNRKFPLPQASLALHSTSASMSSYPFCVDYDKRGTAKCKRCKQTLQKGMVRVGKVTPNPFSESGGDMKAWHHVDCIFESFTRARATTKKIEDPVDDLEGWEALDQEDKDYILKHINEYQQTASPGKAPPRKAATPKKAPQGATPTPSPVKTAPVFKAASEPPKSQKEQKEKPPAVNRNHKDNSFREFRRLCAVVAETSSYLSKTEHISKFFKKGTSGEGFQGDLRLWVKLLLPGVVKRVYNLQSKQIVKLCSQMFGTNLEEMIEDLENGDVAETVRIFHEKSTVLPPLKKSIIGIHDVSDYLDELTGVTREEEQMYILKKIAKQCTSNDFKMVIRLIKADLRINAGAKHILEGVHADAYEAFQTTRDIDNVLEQIITQKEEGTEGSLKIKAQVMTPVLPMLAEACKSVEHAFKKCPNNMYAEIKYDGERVQVHKKGNEFKYFSRSLKPVMNHKVAHFKEYIPQAFPFGKDLILDSEVLLIDTNTGNPLPFGTLGVHKKGEFKDANVCLFIFDCIHYNGENLMDRPIIERRKILTENMVEIKNHIMFSDIKIIKKKADLHDMISRVLKQGLEGLVLKDLQSIYEPGKRHWLKIKKDYLNDGAMADTADLVVLGAWYGSGKKGGMMSIFLMGCYDPRINRWCTVTKVHTGHDDAALEQLQTTLDMEKISQDYSRVPSWLKCNKPMTPDFVCTDPKTSPVWEITGSEFTRHNIHTADGISIRFPRVTKVRDDKTWKEATDLLQLQDLYKLSRECSDMNLDLEDSAGASDKNKGDQSDIEEDEDSLSSVPSKKKGGGGSSGSGSPSPQKRSSGNDSSKTGSPTPKKGSKEKKFGDKKQRTLSDFYQAKESKETKTTEEKKEKIAVKKAKDTAGKNENVDPNMRKHKAEDDSGSPAKKKCKYGESCYNDNEAHRMLYEHPPKKSKHPTINPLPDVFTGVKLCIPDSIEKANVLRRYFIAMDGEVLPSYRSSEASHVILPETEQKEEGGEADGGAANAQRVTVDWLWDSIKLQRLQHSAIYRT